ncbi:hypothetical protein B0H13DRAFT_2281826 [Mycena leptocephala]|nr:hypothetical protein B0H13DRAFT_2281826 [Mycena leptocephala]
MSPLFARVPDITPWTSDAPPLTRPIRAHQSIYPTPAYCSSRHPFGFFHVLAAHESAPNWLLRLNPCATICEGARMLRRPLISDGAEVQPLLCGIPGIQSSRRLPDARCCQVAGTTESPAATVQCDAQKELIQARQWCPRCPHVLFQPYAPRAAFV